MKKKKVVRMLKEMQKTVYNSDMFEKAGPQQKWVIENLLGNAIAELDGYPYAIGLKNKNLIESKVVHPGTNITMLICLTMMKPIG